MLFPGPPWFPRNDTYLSGLIKLLPMRPVYLGLVLNRVTFVFPSLLKQSQIKGPEEVCPDES